MDRWTKKQLEEMNDLDFAICILTERSNKVRNEKVGMSLLPIREELEK